MELGKFSKQDLRNLLVNARRLGREDVARDVVAELSVRGLAERKDYDVFDWNQDKVRSALEPFVAISRAVPANVRTAYTEAGGLKIGRRADDPDRMWIDTYSAIKTHRLNAVIVCYVKKPGDQPFFKFFIDGQPEKQFSADELPQALERWGELAEAAVA